MGIKEIEADLAALKEVLKDKSLIKEKKWKFPMGKKIGKGGRKKNYVTVVILYENGYYDFKKYQVLDQTIMHEKIPRLAAAGYVMFNKKGNPLIILPNWSVEPFSPLEHYQTSLINGTNKKGYAILMEKMQREQLSGKKTIANWVKWVFGIGIAAIVIYAFMSGGI